MADARQSRVVADYGECRVRHSCAACGRDISHRDRQAVYCERGTPCYRRRATERAARERRQHPERVRERERRWYRRAKDRDPSFLARRSEKQRRRIAPYREAYREMAKLKQRERRRLAREARAGASA